MKIIPEYRIQDCSNNISIFNKNKYVLLSDAESESEKTSIGFAEWCVKNYMPINVDIDLYFVKMTNKSKKYTAGDLFKIFIKKQNDLL